MLFGWGKKVKHFFWDDEHVLTVTWSYFSLFLCPVAYEVVWTISGDKRSDDKVISYQQVQLKFPTNTPSISLWHRYGLWMVAGGLILISIFGQNK